MNQAAAADVLVVLPDVNSPLDRFEGWLGEMGVRFTTLRPYAGDVVPHSLRYDGLVVMGGEMSALDDLDHPWLNDIRILFRDAVACGRPTLGICLGGQLLAQALGGTVVVGDRGVENGIVRVHWTSEATDDELLTGLVDPFLTGAYHQDAISELPQQAVWLGSSAMYRHQAFRVGECAWGVQFHPELSPELYDQWAAHYAETADESLLALLARGTEEFTRYDGDVERATREMAGRFGSIVLARRP